MRDGRATDVAPAGGQQNAQDAAFVRAQFAKIRSGSFAHIQANGLNINSSSLDNKKKMAHTRVTGTSVAGFQKYKGGQEPSFEAMGMALGKRKVNKFYNVNVKS